MAPVNPPIQSTNDPQWLGQSKGISQPHFDSSFGQLFKGLGDTLSMGIKGLDQTVKQNITNELENQVYKERDQWTQALEVGKDVVTGQSLTGQSTSEVPEDISQLGDQVGSLHSAASQGKIPRTHYLARLTALAQEYRHRHPTRKKLVDDTISGITGFDPANAYAQQLLADINSVVGRKDDEKKLALSVATREGNLGLPGVAPLVQAVQEGRASPRVLMNHVAKMNMWESQDKFDRAQHEAGERDVKGQKTEASRQITNLMQRRLAGHVEGVELAAGIMSYKQIADEIREVQTGEREANPQRAMVLAGQVRALRNVIVDDIRKEAYKEDLDKQGNPVKGSNLVTRLGGGDQLEEAITKIIDPVINQLATDISKERYDMASTMSQALKARTDIHQNALVKSSVGDDIIEMGIIDKMAPAFASKFFQFYLRGNGDTKFKEWLSSDARKAVSQHQSNPAKIGQPVVMNDQVRAAAAAGMTAPKDFDQYIKLAERISDPETPDNVRKQLAVWAFDPANRGLISQFNKDSVDPETGRRIPGQMSIFKRMTSKPITDAIVKLNDPTIAQNYVNWAEETFGRELFQREIKDLTNFQFLSNMALKWDSEKTKFELVVGNISGAKRDAISDFVAASPRATSAMKKKGDEILERLNGGLRNMREIAKFSETDTEAYLVKLLMELGFDPTKGNPVTFPEHIMQAIVSARTAKVKGPR